jgi:hypothetical protein
VLPTFVDAKSDDYHVALQIHSSHGPFYPLRDDFKMCAETDAWIIRSYG